MPENTLLQFDGDEARIRFVVDNHTDASTSMTDPETGEDVMFLFAVVTQKSHDGDLKLAKMCAAMERASVHHHTYDAKSGAKYRMTRIGVTRSRLQAYADSTNFVCSFDTAAIGEAAEKASISLSNPDTTEGRSWYPPYEHLCAPFDLRKPKLYMPFAEGTCLQLCRRLVCGSPSFKDPSARGCGFDVDRLERSSEKDSEFVLGMFPLHNHKLKENLEQEWLPLTWPWRLPVNEIRGYLGEEVGFYFGFLGHLTTGFLPLAPVGILATIASVSGQSSGGFERRSMYPEAFFALLATSAYSVVLDSWRYKQNTLAHLWTTFGAASKLPPRPGFNGVVIKSPVDGNLTLDFPKALRDPRSNLSHGMTTTMIVMLVACTASIFIFKAILIQTGASPGMLMVPSLLNSVQITVFGLVYKKLAKAMTDYENHKTVLEHNSELFQKLSLFYFCNNYSTLFYISFGKRFVEGCHDPIYQSDSCGLELSFQVMTVFLVNDFFSRMMNSVVQPYVKGKLKLLKASFDATIDVENMGVIEKEYTLLEKYDPTSELVMDYIELFVQWGFLTLFGSACPMVVAFACVTNFTETRTDGRKLLFDFRRVMPFQVDGIGEPLNVFYYLLWLSVPVNSALIVWCFKAFSFFPADHKVWCFVAVSLFLGMMLVQLDTLIPDVPKKTLIQVQRQDVVYRRVVLEIDDHDEDMALDLDTSMLGRSSSEVKKKKKKIGSSAKEPELAVDGIKVRYKSETLPASQVKLSYISS